MTLDQFKELFAAVKSVRIAAHIGKDPVTVRRWHFAAMRGLQKYDKANGEKMMELHKKTFDTP